MYLGEFICKIDDKNRLIIPAKFNKRNSDIILTYIDQDTIVVSESIDEIKNIFSSLTDEVKNKMIKYALMNSYVSHVDAQGRVILTNMNINFKEAMVCGCGEYFVICNKEKYLEEKSKLTSEVNAFLESREGENFTKGLVFY